MSMRMRKKRNFETRMDACKDLLLARGAGGILNMKEAAENYRDLVDFSKVFGNNRPVELEIGCGKGGFICELAARNKGVNYLALEKMSWGWETSVFSISAPNACPVISPKIPSKRYTSTFRRRFPSWAMRRSG